MSGKEVWCAAKSPRNEGGEKWKGDCRKCCRHCEGKPCDLRVCYMGEKDDLCAHKCSPSEWMMGRIDESAREETYQRRRVEFWLKRGFKEGDGSWEGQAIKDLRKKYGKKFGTKYSLSSQ